MHELFIHRAISLLNTIASGKQIGYPNLGLEFTVDNGGTKPASGRFLSKHVRLWHGDKLIVTQARASRAKFWSQLVSDTHVGQERRTISRTALRATVELLVEKHFHGQLSPQERRSIDAKDRAWVDRNGIELTQIFGLEAELSDLGGIDRNRLFEQGPRFAKEANAILDALIQHPTPAFRPFVAQLKDRHPRIAWDSESRRVAFLYDKR